MTSDEFSAQYRHPKWQKLRLKVLERDKFKCRLCDDDKTQLHAHHINYKSGKRCWDYPVSDLITLCVPCHDCVGSMIKLLRKAMICRDEFSMLLSVLTIIIENPTTECFAAIELISLKPHMAREVINFLSDTKTKNEAVH